MGGCCSSRIKAISRSLSFSPPDDVQLSSEASEESPSLHALPVAQNEDDFLRSTNVKSFTFSELKTATRNFRPDSFLGEGGFGSVFKGWIDEQNLTPAKPGTGMVVAVKRLDLEGLQGHKEWLAEINHLSQLHHPNLVKLIGYCSEDEQRLLVYEYMCRGSLEHHLFRRGTNFEPLSWRLRIKVALGAAKGLAFLHNAEKKVIYRDFKTSNILLDLDYNAKISDFGLAKFGPLGDKSHVSTRVMGTDGYAAPEYLATGRLCTKCDVYSFGVVLLELLSGKRAIDMNRPTGEHKLVNWAKPLLCSKRRYHRVFDRRIEGQYSSASAVKAALLAFKCLALELKLRPNMDEVIITLEQLQEFESTAADCHGEKIGDNQNLESAWHKPRSRSSDRERF